MATTNSFPAKPGDDSLRKMPDAGGTLGDKAKGLTDAAVEKVKDAAGSVADSTREAAANLGHQADRATHAVGNRMESMGHTLRDRMPNKGVLGAATARVADGLETGGKYLEDEGLKDIAGDVTNLIRRNPIPSILVGVALGYLVGRFTSRS